jgi:hypothetical protein
MAEDSGGHCNDRVRKCPYQYTGVVRVGKSLPACRRGSKVSQQGRGRGPWRRRSGKDRRRTGQAAARTAPRPFLLAVRPRPCDATLSWSRVRLSPRGPVPRRRGPACSRSAVPAIGEFVHRQPLPRVLVPRPGRDGGDPCILLPQRDARAGLGRDAHPGSPQSRRLGRRRGSGAQSGPTRGRMLKASSDEVRTAARTEAAKSSRGATRQAGARVAEASRVDRKATTQRVPVL